MLSFFLTSALLFQGGDLVLAVDRLHDGKGGVLEDATVTIADGRIRSVSRGRAPDGAIRVPGAELSPGLIDAFSYMGVGWATVDDSRETTASYRVARSAALHDPAFRRAAQEGVTSAFISPDSWNVFGGLGAFVKTAGGEAADLFAPADSAARVVDDANALKISVGNDPSIGNYPPRGGTPRNMRARRPNTRMGVVWVIRKEFYRAKAYRNAREAGDAAEDPDLEVLLAAMDGRLPVRVQARRAHDVETALRIQAEFGLPRIIIEEGTESHRHGRRLAESGVAVVAGPAYDERLRSITSSPSLAELRLWADPPTVCCEDDDHAHLGPYAEPDLSGRVALSGLALDLFVTAIPRSEAAGLYSGRFSEGDLATPALAALLRESGCTTALGAAEAHDASSTEASVIHQARQAVRFGLDPQEALAMVTSVPAELCGQDAELGTVESGKQADLVLWSGPPLSATSRPILVLVDGRIVVDRRSTLEG